MTTGTDLTAVRGADLLAETLIACGVDTIFGLPGDTGVIFYDALYSRADRLRHVLVRDERHAGAMADAYARVTNRVGVVEVSSGGGTTYVVGGLGEAAASGVPILLITSDIARSSRNTGALTEIDQSALFSAVTKWRRVVDAAADIPAAVAEALDQATTGRPGPVALILAEDVLDEVIHAAAPVAPAGADRLPRVRAAAAPEQIAAVAEMLTRADRPVVLAGSGVHTSQAWTALAALADKAGIPVATTIHGKATIPDSHPFSLGVVGNNGARDYANEYLRKADAVLVVGSRANATDTDSWTGPPRTGVPVAQIDIEESRAGRNFPDAIAIAGDARLVLDQLVEAMPPADPDTKAGRADAIARSRSSWQSRGPRGSTRVADGQLLPADVIRRVNEILGPDALVLADPGTPTPNVASYWETATAGRTVISPRGHGPMGYAIPAAAGAAFAAPGRPVVSVTADGSFAMACGELETVARFELPILFIQFTNNSLGWIKMLQHLYAERRYFGVDPGPIDAVAVAKACGLAAEHVTSLDRLEVVVRKYAEDREPVYLDLDVPHMIDYTPPVSSWLDGLAGDAARPVY